MLRQASHVLGCHTVAVRGMPTSALARRYTGAIALRYSADAKMSPMTSSFSTRRTSAAARDTLPARRAASRASARRHRTGRGAGSSPPIATRADVQVPSVTETTAATPRTA